MYDDAGYLGRHQRGVEVPVAVRAETAGVPGWPAAPPTLTVIAPDGTKPYQRAMAADLQGVAPGTFRLGVFLGQTFTQTGRHTVVVRYADGGAAARVVMGWFDLVPGGAAEGAVTALHHAARPDAHYLIRSTDAGLMKRGRNPR